MAWKESSPMSERLACVQACLDRRKRIVEICSEFGINEKGNRGFYHATTDCLAVISSLLIATPPIAPGR